MNLSVGQSIYLSVYLFVCLPIHDHKIGKVITVHEMHHLPHHLVGCHRRINRMEWIEGLGWCG